MALPPSSVLSVPPVLAEPSAGAEPPPQPANALTHKKPANNVANTLFFILFPPFRYCILPKAPLPKGISGRCPELKSLPALSGRMQLFRFSFAK